MRAGNSLLQPLSGARAQPEPDQATKRRTSLRRLVGAGVCLLALSAGAAQAQWATLCVNCTDEITEVAREAARIQQVVHQIQTLQLQLEQLQQVYSSMAHLPGAALADLQSTLNVPQLRNPLPGGSAPLGQIVNGNGLGLMAGLGRQYFDQNHIFAPADPGGYGAASLGQNANSIAGVQAMADQLYQSAASHISALQGLEGLLAGAPDAKAVADISARVQTEQTYLAAQQVQAQTISNWQGAQVRNNEQQRRESRRCYIEAALQSLNSGQDAGSDACAQPAANTVIASADAASPTAAGDGGAMVASGYGQFLGQSVGSGQCVALVQAADPNVGLTRTWTQGAQVMGNTSLQPGTAIATFGPNGTYTNSTDGSSHAAIYLGQNAQGIQVEDQWLGHAASVRTIAWSSTSGAANRGSAFYVINH